MALGWFDHLSNGHARALSAGSEPADAINPMAVEAMAEVGIDITRQTPKRWTDEVLDESDVVVTMGCGDTCPFVPGTRYEDWPLEDPAGKDLATVRRVRDEIKDRVEHLLAGLDAHA
jgi:protein-tyrosine-phosphatase